MVEFIGGGVKENDADGNGGFAPAPGAGVVPGRFAHGAPEEQGEDGIFREMSAFANDVVDGFDARLGHVREKPVQERFDNERRMLVRPGIAGAEKDQGHPKHRQQPIADERTDF